jgi:hypothetical protein
VKIKPSKYNIYESDPLYPEYEITFWQRDNEPQISIFSYKLMVEVDLPCAAFEQIIDIFDEWNFNE